MMLFSITARPDEGRNPSPKLIGWTDTRKYVPLFSGMSGIYEGVQS